MTLFQLPRFVGMNDRMIMNDELESMWQDIVVAYFKALS